MPDREKLIRPGWSAALGLVVALVLLAPAASAGIEAGTIVTSAEIEIADRVELDASSAALHVREDGMSVPEFTLEADRIELRGTYERGTTTADRDRLGTVSYLQDEYDERLPFENVTARLDRFDVTPEILAFPNASSPSSPSVGAHGQAGSAVSSFQDAYLVRTGTKRAFEDVPDVCGPPVCTPSSEVENGFWYRVEGPWLRLSGLQSGHVSGDFHLFVNNVTLEVSDEDGVAWRNWTGFRTEPGPTPGTKRYEIRSVVLEVMGGNLTVASPSNLEVLGPAADVFAKGSIFSPEVAGELRGSGTLYHFDDAPLHLVGEGRLGLRTLPDAAGSRGASVEERSKTVLTAGEGFEVVETPGLQTSSVPVERDVAAGAWSDVVSSWLPWIILALLAGVVVVYSQRDVVLSVAAGARAKLRRHRMERWLETGDRLIEASDPEGALPWYRRTTETYPESMEGWVSLASCLMDLKRFEEASRAYERGHEAMANGDAPMLVSAASCAMQADDIERAYALLREAARRDQAYVQKRFARGEFPGIGLYDIFSDVVGSGREDDLIDHSYA